MKIFLTCLCLSLPAAATPKTPAWTRVHKPEVIGWSYVRFSRKGGELFALPGLSVSRDDGRTWKDIQGDIQGIDLVFKTSKEWIGVYEPLLQTQLSSDRGGTWTALASYENDHPENLAFFDEKNGFGIDSVDKTLMVTSDGGKTWERKERQSRLGFSDPRASWIFDGEAGAIAVGDFHDVRVLRTEDRGMTWNTAVIKDTELPDALCFSDRMRGWLLTDGRSPEKTALWATKDGGKTWSRTALALDKPRKKLSGIACGDGDSVWAAGPGLLMASKDGGRTWSSLDAPPTEKAEEVGIHHGTTPDGGYLLIGTNEPESTGSPDGVGEDKPRVFPNGAIYRLRLGAAAR